ncbi:MAG: hypothetical protein IJA32_08460 [Lachnospiraceae bacterium]|nr:hypothetical protein [Lachnospiraceae bacterium]
MIKIDDSKFDWEILEKIYNKLTIRVIEKYYIYKNTNKKNKLILLFENEFGTTYEKQKTKLYNFLLYSTKNDMLDIINKFSLEKYMDDKSKIVGAVQNCSSKTIIKNVIKNIRKKVNVNDIEWSLFEQDFLVFISNIDVNKKFTKTYKNNFLSNSKIYSKYTGQDELLEFISYDNITEEERNLLLRAMNVRVCPYCNRSYISNYIVDGHGKIKATADLDHFFLKSKYPIVSMCLHNFIPSCPICNSRLKKDKDFVLCEHIYPYDESFNYDGRFALDNINFIYGKKPQYSIHISENSAIKEKIRHSVETFKINELYKNHIDYVDEIISKAQIYGSSQFDEFLDNFSDMFESKEKLERLVYGNYLMHNDQDKRPLAKLTQDILNDLGIHSL